MTGSLMAEESIGIDSVEDPPVFSQETSPADIFVAPSVYREQLHLGASYTHYSSIPSIIGQESSTECVLGVDEAGRGPVLGPMVYGVFYMPKNIEKTLLADKHHFDDSKVLTPMVRSNLMQKLCTQGSDLYESCGWATRVMSARDISAGMLKPFGSYNLNAQAMDATIALINGVLDQGVNVREIFVDTIGNPSVYQKKLERIFPTVEITVAKKADSLYPCVSAASVCAKVTRDAALEVSYETVCNYFTETCSELPSNQLESGWGSGYPSDSKCVTWLRQNMNPLFGWGPECRFSWGTAVEMLEAKTVRPKVVWPDRDGDNTEDSLKVTQFFTTASAMDGETEVRDELVNFFGKRVSEKIF